MGAREVDVIVIGAGAVGENVADYAIQGGLSTVIVESELVGGECSYWACMPSKALLRPVRARGRAIPGRGAGRHREIDVAAVLARRDRIHERPGTTRPGGLARQRRHRPRARSRAPARPAPSGRHGRRRTGHRAGGPPRGRRLHRIRRPCSRRSTGSRTRCRGRAARRPPPRRSRPVAVLGGGVVGCRARHRVRERSAPRVTLVARRGLLGEPGAVRGRAGRARPRGGRGRGVAGRTERDGCPRRRDGRSCDIAMTTDPHPSRTTCSSSPTGRTAALTSSASRTSALAADVRVDDATHARVPGDWLYAVGDVNGRALLTHQGKYQARAAGGDRRPRGRAPVRPPRWSAHVATADHARRPAGHLHRPGGRLGRPHRGRRPTQAGLRTSASSTTTSACGRRARRALRRLHRRRPRHRRRRPRGRRGRDLRRPGRLARCCTQPPSRSSARCRSTDSGTPFRPTRP